MNHKSRKGQAMAEYIILTALIAIGSMAIIQVLGSNLRRKVAQISEAVRGESSTRFEGIQATQDHYKIYDMGDFTDAIRDNSSDQ